MEPLRVVAHLASPVALPVPCILDGPLFAAIVRQRADQEGVAPEDLPRLDPRDELPLAIERSGKHWISRCSDAIYDVQARDVAYWSKRTDVDIATELLSRDRTLSLKSNRYRNHRQPLYLVVASHLTWYVMGDRQRIEHLLPYVRGIGKKRGYGYGAVHRWEVEPIATDLSLRTEDGAIARPIPLHHNRLGRQVIVERVMALACNPPYWTGHNVVECVVQGRWR